MKIILDTNIIISALIKNSLTRKIIKTSNWNFYYPEEALKEIQKYENLIIEKADITKREYFNLIWRLLKNIKIVPNNQISHKFAIAEKIMNHIDPKDTIFVAVNLKIKNSVIWSDDKDFDKQNKVKVMKTKEIMERFKYV